MTKCLRFLVPFSLVAIAQAGPPLITDDPDTPERGHWEINVATTAEKRDAEWALETPLLDLNYGFRDNIQLKFEVPYLIEDEEGGHSRSGFGDSEFGVKWRFLDQAKHGVSVSTYPQFSFNNSEHSVRHGLTEDGWSFLLPVEIQRELTEELTVFGEVGYTWSEHETNSLLWGIAAEYAFCEKFSLLGEFHGESLPGFREQEIVANLGFHWQTCETTAMIGSIGRGVAEGGEPLPKVLGYLALQFTF